MAHPPVPGRGPTNHLIVLLEVRHDHTVPQGDAPKKVIQQETNTARIQQNPEPRNELIQQNQEGGEAPIERVNTDARQEEGVGSSTMQTMVFGLMTFAAVTGIAVKYLLPDPLNVSTLPATLSDLYPSVLIEMQNWGRDLGHVAGVGITGTTSHPPSTTTVTITEFLQATVTITAQPTENHSPASTCGVSFPTQLDQLE
ncbi:hypothetical protein BDN72DRAFT_320195 [Pluteus cervinus]|uniref:Uncharacterized protein n=1 Tax=Pluteus cervinus TaxID=181527 RepID=A0ACD3ACL9_9AGAR|nr:hypothetical protein BDN72DRAFT_320195 [Pluteus cervinus]